MAMRPGRAPPGARHRADDQRPADHHDAGATESVRSDAPAPWRIVHRQRCEHGHGKLNDTRRWSNRHARRPGNPPRGARRYRMYTGVDRHWHTELGRRERRSIPRDLQAIGATDSVDVDRDHRQHGFQRTHTLLAKPRALVAGSPCSAGRCAKRSPCTRCPADLLEAARQCDLGAELRDSGEAGLELRAGRHGVTFVDQSSSLIEERVGGSLVACRLSQYRRLPGAKHQADLESNPASRAGPRPGICSHVPSSSLLRHCRVVSIGRAEGVE